MGEFSKKDFISDLPQSIIEIILTKVPIRDAVRTSTLSTKWKYQWATITQLVIDKECVDLCDNRNVSENGLVNFVIRYFLLHDGPIDKFELSTPYLIRSSDMDTLLIFLSRKNIKELLLRACQCKDRRRFRTPSCIFSCQKLTTLKLNGFKLKHSLGFQGFPCLKYLNLFCCKVTLEVIENLISGCPLLEKFKFRNYDNLALTIRSPNLKHLSVSGMFKDIKLSFISEDWDDNVLVKVPVTYDCLKVISLGEINFEELHQVSYALNLLLQSPNLLELHIVAGNIDSFYEEAADLDFWERECPTDFTFKHLKIVHMSFLSNKNDIEFLKFVLRRSPVLEVMNISTYKSFYDELLCLQQASPKVKLHLFD